MPPRTSLQRLPTAFPPTFLLPSLERLSLSGSTGASTATTTATTTTTLQQTRGIRSIQKPIHKGARFDHEPGKPLLRSSQAAAFLRKLPTMPLRPGLLGYKREMSAIYDPDTGARQPVTIIQLDRNQVVAHKLKRQHGYIAACMGCGAKGTNKTTRAMLGEFAARGVPIKRHLREFRVAKEKWLPPVGSLIGADWFTVGQYVDAKANSRGMGFAGGMKRHGFRGQDASHGASLSHRSMGSAGQGQGGGSRVLPGKRMAGRMGGESVTVHNLKVVRVDKENGLVVVAGAVPGPERGLVKLIDAVKKPWPEMPSAYAEMHAVAEEAPVDTKAAQEAKRA